MAFNLIKSQVVINPRFLEKFASQRVRRVINDRLTKGRARSEEIVKKIIEDAIKDSMVYKGLNGNFANLRSYDLQAEFGIRDPAPALEKLIEILKDTVNARVSNTEERKGGRVVVGTLEISYLDEDKYIDQLQANDNLFTVQSQSTVNQKVRGKKKKSRVLQDSYKIPWMQILLDGKASSPDKFIPNIKQYGITYDLNSYEKSISRSGRAIMTKQVSRTSVTFRELGNKRRNVNFPYMLPLIAVPSAGAKNFIDEIRQNRALKKIIQQKVRKFLDTLE